MLQHINKIVEVRNAANYVKAKLAVAECGFRNGITYYKGNEISEEEYQNLFLFDNSHPDPKKQLKENIDGTSKWLKN